jgi:hypothetical protein
VTRISTFYVMGCALAVIFALSTNGASAGPLNGANPPPPKIPHIRYVITVPANQQQLSLWGVHTVTQQKRDRLNGASGASETHSGTSNY